MHFQECSVEVSGRKKGDYCLHFEKGEGNYIFTPPPHPFGKLPSLFSSVLKLAHTFRFSPKI